MRSRESVSGSASQCYKQMGPLTVKLPPYTMGGPKALHNAFEMVEIVQQNKINGDFVECGVILIPETSTASL